MTVEEVLSKKRQGSYIVEGKFDIPKNNNIALELIVLEKEQILIDDIRNLKEKLSRKNEKFRVCFIKSFIWSEVVQNSLLKTIEEGAPFTAIFIICPNQNQILKTILSRTIILDNILNTDVDPKVKNFLDEAFYKRMNINFVKKMISEEENREEVYYFLKNVVLEYSKFNKSQKIERNIELINEIYTPGSSIKNIIEFNALTLK